MTQHYVLLLLFVVLPIDGADCPAGWMVYTIGNKCYKLFSAKKSWNLARNACGKARTLAKLAELKDYNNNDFIRINFGITAWIGSHRCGQDTCFLNNQYVPYTPYAPDEPDMKSDQHQQTTHRNAVGLKANDFGILILKNGWWADEPKQNKYPYICEMPALEKSCSHLYKTGRRKSGIYTIDPDGSGSFKVWCDMETNGGGWTVFQRRVDGNVYFFRGWSAYKAGFGYLNGSFWLGFDKIRRLTKSGQKVLRIDLVDFDLSSAYAQYNKFAVGKEHNGYKLKISRYTGNAGDSLLWLNRMKFTTSDRDNDEWKFDCAEHKNGAWWYKACGNSNLNGNYLKQGARSQRGISWYGWKGDYRSMKKADMKLRPAI